MVQLLPAIAVPPKSGTAVPNMFSFTSIEMQQDLADSA